MSQPEMPEEVKPLAIAAQLGKVLTLLEVARDNVLTCVAIAPVHPDALSPLVTLHGELQKMMDAYGQLLQAHLNNAIKRDKKDDGFKKITDPCGCTLDFRNMEVVDADADCPHKHRRGDSFSV
jgi:hypothetical protein